MNDWIGLNPACTKSKSDLHVVKNDVAELKETTPEGKQRDRPFQYLRGIVLKARTAAIDELSHLTAAAVAEKWLTEAEPEEKELADAIVPGRDRQTRELLHLLVESSWGIGEDDVRPAARRAALLANTGKTTRPVAAGRWATPEAHISASELKVLLEVNGHVLAPGNRN